MTPDNIYTQQHGIYVSIEHFNKCIEEAFKNGVYAGARVEMYFAHILGSPVEESVEHIVEEIKEKVKDRFMKNKDRLIFK